MRHLLIRRSLVAGKAATFFGDRQLAPQQRFLATVSLPRRGTVHPAQGNALVVTQVEEWNSEGRLRPFPPQCGSGPAFTPGNVKRLTRECQPRSRGSCSRQGGP
jgi:hypothetical protein